MKGLGHERVSSTLSHLEDVGSMCEILTQNVNWLRDPLLSLEVT